MENYQTDTPPSSAPNTPDAPLVSPANNELGSSLQNEPTITHPNSVPQVPPVTIPQTAAEPGTTTTSGSSFLTGSHIQEDKPKLPTGIYVITGFTLLGVITGLFDDSQTGIIYTVSMIFSLLLAVGLVFRMETARKFMVGLSILLLIISAVSMLLLAGFQSKFEQSKSNYEEVVSRIDQSRITEKQKQQLDELSAALASQSKLVGSAFTLIYFKLGFTALVQIAVIVYLTRPKIKEVFEVAR